jgi:hypothetical protein
MEEARHPSIPVNGITHGYRSLCVILTFKLGISRRLQNDMLGLKGRVLYGSEDVFPFKERIICENLFKCGAGTQQVQNIRDPDAQAANARPAPAFARLNGNSLK